jgi:tellurite resistance protein TehA-like permease
MVGETRKRGGVALQLSLLTLAIGLLALAATWPFADTGPAWLLIPVGLLVAAEERG